MKTRNWIILLIFVGAILFGFNMYGAYQKQTAVRPVPCLDPEVFLEQHQHATLQIVVDGALEIIPTDIGVTASCQSALHTHDDTGTLHVEAQDVYPYSLGDFFRVWGKPIERNGYTLTIFVDALPYSKAPEDIVLKDKQQIILSYVRIR
jgi:hypothetical protein